MSGSLLLIEDERDIAKLMEYNLHTEGYTTEWFASAEEGLERLKSSTFDLILLDLMLPGMSGLEFCRRVRRAESTQHIPIIMVTAKGSEEEVVRGLETGADDYITKPFSPAIFLARVKSVLRRHLPTHLSQEEIYSVGNLTMDLSRHQVTVDGETVELTLSEFQILRVLTQRPGWVFTRTQLVDALHGKNYAVTERTIDFQMVGLRRKLGPKCQIETIRGVGYRFQESI